MHLSTADRVLEISRFNFLVLSSRVLPRDRLRGVVAVVLLFMSRDVEQCWERPRDRRNAGSEVVLAVSHLCGNCRTARFGAVGRCRGRVVQDGL